MKATKYGDTGQEGYAHLFILPLLFQRESEPHYFSLSLTIVRP